jgi:hypothetical protein
VPWFRRLVAGFSARRPAFVPERDLWWTKWLWNRFFSEFFRLPCQYHSPVALHIHMSNGGWAVSPMVAAVQTHSLTPSVWTTATYPTLYKHQIKLTLFKFRLLNAEARFLAHNASRSFCISEISTGASFSQSTFTGVSFALIRSSSVRHFWTVKATWLEIRESKSPSVAWPSCSILWTSATWLKCY